MKNIFLVTREFHLEYVPTEIVNIFSPQFSKPHTISLWCSKKMEMTAMKFFCDFSPRVPRLSLLSRNVSLPYRVLLHR